MKDPRVRFKLENLAFDSFGVVPGSGEVRWSRIAKRAVHVAVVNDPEFGLAKAMWSSSGDACHELNEIRPARRRVFL